jgi:hypothetical protein
MEAVMRKNVFAIVATFCLIFSAAPAHAQTKAGLHLEVCTEWREFNGNLYTRNVCSRTVVIQFMTLDDNKVVVQRLERNEAFDTGINFAQAKARGWMASTCPVDFRTDIAFTGENQLRYFGSDYDCVPR